MSLSRANSFEFVSSTTPRITRGDYRRATPRVTLFAEGMRQTPAHRSAKQGKARVVAPVYEPVRITGNTNKRQLHLRRKTRRLIRSLSAASILIALSMAGYSFHTQVVAQPLQPEKNTQNVKGLAQATPVNPGLSAVRPSESDVSAHTMPATHPKILEISSLGIRARIYGLGTTKEGSIAAPKNIYNVGWYEGSALPNEAGVTFIDGHYGLGIIGGVFKNLARLKAGETIVLKTGNDTTYTYKIASSHTSPLTELDMREVLAPSESGKNELVLMTCAGKQIPGTTSMDERTVVRAVQQ